MKFFLNKYSTVPAIFDSHLKILQKEWAQKQYIGWKDTSYLREEVGYRILESIKDLKELPNNISLIGSPSSSLIKGLNSEGRNVSCFDITKNNEYPNVSILEKESSIPPLKNCELLISSLNMHWINDLSQYTKEIYKELPLKSSFIGSLFGGETLYELRSSFILGQERLDSSSVYPHLSPTISAPDLSSLLFSSEFKNVTVSSEFIKIVYPSLKVFLKDLQAMGESGAPMRRGRNLTKSLLKAVEEEYSLNYKTSIRDGSLEMEGIQATFEVLSFIAWKE